MDIHVPMWLVYVCLGAAVFVAGMATMFVIGLMIGRTKTTKLIETNGEQDG